MVMRRYLSSKGLVIKPNGFVAFICSILSSAILEEIYIIGMLSLVLIRFAASMPSIPFPNVMSINTRSGHSSSVFLTASSPEETVAATPYPISSSLLWISMAIIGSSSTTRICFFTQPPPMCIADCCTI